MLRADDRSFGRPPHLSNALDRIAGYDEKRLRDASSAGEIMKELTRKKK